MQKENSHRSLGRRGKTTFSFPQNNKAAKAKKRKRKKKKKKKGRSYDDDGVMNVNTTGRDIGPQEVRPPPLPNGPPSPRLFDNVKNNPQYVTEYLPFIFRYFRETEGKYRPRTDFINEQHEVTDQMRSILIDWLFDVHAKFKMQRETLFLCVNLIDRFLSHVKISKRRFQLLGIAALYIASKYEEIYIPSVCDLESICAHTYDSNQILRMEKMVLTALKFSLTVVTPNQLVPVMMECARSIPGSDDVTRKKMQQVVEYLTEVTLGFVEMNVFTPSMIAAGCIYMAGKIVFGDTFEWNGIFKYYVGYEKGTLMPCVNAISNCLERLSSKSMSKLTACRRKFATPECGGVTAFVESRRQFFAL